MGKKWWLVAQVPFADHPRSHNRHRLKHFGDRDFVGMQAVGRDGSQHLAVARVIVHADALWSSSR